MASTMRFDNWQTTDGTSIATTNASGDITFAGAVAGAGKILQVVSATFGQYSSSSATNGPAVQTLNITPSSTSSKILLMMSSSLRCNMGSSSTYQTAYVEFYNSTSATTVSLGHFYQDTAAGDNITNSCDMMAIDTPASSSQQTYELLLRCAVTTGFVRLAHIGTGGQEGHFIAMEVSG